MVNFANIKQIEIPEGIVKQIDINGTVLWKLENGGLPSEYQQVEYIQSSGSQYIDTGISGNATGEYEITMDALGSTAHSYEQYFAGTRNTSTTYVGKIFYNNTSVTYQGHPQGGDLVLGNLSDILNIKVTRQDGIVVNNVVKSSYNGAPWGGSTFWVFNSHEESSLGASMRLYNLIMYSNGEKVRDFIPCYRKSDNVIGLYDLVSNTFFTNAGSGTFISGEPVYKWPKDYQKVEYIESTGTQYIDTDYKPNGNTKTELDFEGFSTPSGIMFGSYNNSWTTQSFGVYFNEVNSLDGVWRHYSDNTKVMTPSPASGNFILDKGNVIYNGVTQYTSNSKTFTCPNNMYIFCGYGYSSAFSQKTSYKLKRFKIYENDVLIKDFVPCYRKSDNIIGLYDIVGNNFYTNIGTGVFIKGGDV